MKYLHFIFAVLAFSLLFCCTTGPSKQTMNNNDILAVQEGLVNIDDSTFDGLIVYFPQFSRIDLVCGTMPSQQDTTIVFCAEAAFTHELLDEFKHSNIDGCQVQGQQWRIRLVW